MKLKRAKPAPTPEPRIKAVEVIRGQEETGAQGYFNPDREISEADWRAIKAEYEMKKSTSFLSDVADIAIIVDTIAPQKKEYIGITEEDELMIQGEVGSLIEVVKNKWTVMTSLATLSLAAMVNNREQGSYDDFKGWLRINKKDVDNYRAENKWSGVANQLYMLAFTPPEMHEGIEVTLKDVEGVRSVLEDERAQGKWMNFLQYAFMMAMMSAEKVELTDDDRIEVTLKQSAAQLKDPEPLPPRPSINP